MKEIDILRDTDLFVLDMDGTFYLGNNILDGALEFLEAVKRTGKRYMFFTNNSSTNSDRYIEKLAGMNCFIDKNQIMTSGDVMIRFLKSNYAGKSVYLLGTKPLEDSFIEAGVNLFNRDNEDALAPDNLRERPDIVVVGFDKELDFKKLSNACTYIREGSLFLATHLDINCPMPGGFIPDCGAICKAIELSTGKSPKFVGKPFRETVDMIVDATKVSREKIAFVGDRIYTDVACGVNNGARGILVLTGECKLSDAEKSDIKPDAIFDSIYEMGTILNANN
ncbi:MAG: HAD-IIA family hydrolase [Butyrivibrio sp.]|uniref:HAD-IIA family hydrolase n=1 Tax=Butyrivibrio sp. TaxID=28121 RepID=UPI001B209919|nr:HAD-IIA family hydrolase [Butyrivibrio sp.]MBO6239456.1 HAD-IIA family hydrolase [Butyrivibrio sp.]